MSDGEAETPRTKRSRSQRFRLTAAGREAERAHRQDIVASRAGAGRKSFDAARPFGRVQRGRVRRQAQRDREEDEQLSSLALPPALYICTALGYRAASSGRPLDPNP